MKLLTSKMIRELPRKSELTHERQEDLVIYYHLYNPIGNGDWFVCAADKVDNSILLYGIEVLEDVSIKQFSLKFLEDVELPFKFKIKRDKSFKMMTLKELREQIHILI